MYWRYFSAAKNMIAKINNSGKLCTQKKDDYQKESYPEVTVFTFCSVSPTIGC
jgi:hypothetical protein